VIVPIRNEAANLRACLESVHWADEIFVVDSHSTDGSIALAESLGAKVVQFDFNGTWPKKKNWALENLPFRHEWIFLLDADEIAPPQLRDEAVRIVSGTNDVAGYWINRRYHFMGQWLKHCYFPNWNMRLFRHRLGRFEKITDRPTQSGDNEVHEHVVINGPTARLNSILDHYAFPSIEVFIEKHNRYSNWEARVAADRADVAAQAGALESGVAWRRRFRQLMRHLPFRPLLRFLYVYIGHRGFLDGKAGFYFARLHAVYEFLIIAKTEELKRAEKSD
jgi:glycosyltransferase involved in cell wall biosynthesis